MGRTINIERNKIDYFLTDIMPVEVSELFSYGKFYEYLLEHQKEINEIIHELMKEKTSGNQYLFNGGNWASAPLKYNILKGVNQQREINLAQPISALNIYFFIECYQKEILSYLENNCYFSLRYHRKNNNLYYKRKSNRMTEYFSKTSQKIDRGILQQTGAYFRIHKFNSVTDFTNSRMWQMCNSKYKYFAKVDYKSCFSSIYTHTYKWIIERNTTDSKAAQNSNLLIIIDRLLQNINGKSSNGVIVGPEFSRMIAEILLQHIDKEILYSLQSENLFVHKDYRIFRYVDDIFIFANTPIIIDKVVDTIESVASKYLLHINELKSYTAETPVVLNNWIEKTRALSDKISDLFYKKKEMHDNTEIKALVKNGYISLDRLKNEFTILMTSYPSDRRYIVSYILSTLLNNISNKKDGYNLFEERKTNKAFIFLELAFYVYSFCPCFEHTQRVISMIVYFDDELQFKTDEKNSLKLLNLVRRYSFIFENANLNDICNWFVFFNEYKISLLQHSERCISNKILNSDNPILMANYLIYSRYNYNYYSQILEQMETIINNRISSMIPFEPLLQKEFWYVIVFHNCPYLSASLKTNIQNKISEIHMSDNSVCAKANNLIHDYLVGCHKNSFFYWGYYQFSTSKQLTYRTYQRTLFRQYKKKRPFEIYGSLDW